MTSIKENLDFISNQRGRSAEVFRSEKLLEFSSFLSLYKKHWKLVKLT